MLFIPVKELLRELKLHIPRSTLKKLSHILDIEMTRLFRIKSGAEPKYSEYCKIMSQLMEIKGEEDINYVFNKFVECASRRSMDELHLYMKRRIRLSNITKESSERFNREGKYE